MCLEKRTLYALQGPTVSQKVAVKTFASETSLDISHCLTRARHNMNIPEEFLFKILSTSPQLGYTAAAAEKLLCIWNVLALPFKSLNCNVCSIEHVCCDVHTQARNTLNPWLHMIAEHYQMLAERVCRNAINRNQL